MTVARNLAGEPRRTWIEMDLCGRPAVVAPALAAVVLEDRTQEEHALSVTATSPSHGMVGWWSGCRRGGMRLSAT
jgi:hypothetical protein